jgi:hypothetical protein
MTKNESVALYQSLNKLGNLKGVKFAYGVSRNISLLKPEIESLEKAVTVSEEYKEFENKRIALVEKFSKKDEKGKFVKVNNNYEIEEGKQEELDKEFEALKAENQEVFDSRLKQIEEYNELLKTESTVVLYKVALSEVPTDISVQQMFGISAIVDEAVPSPYPSK